MTATRTTGVLLVCFLLSLTPVAGVEGSGSERLDKQVRIFERALDDMLVESPNWLVTSREATSGTYIEGRGALFAFKADLNSRGVEFGGGSWRVYHEGGDVVVIHDDRSSRRRREAREKLMPYEEDLYSRGKEEILETIVDFGEVLSELGDGDWLEIRARLRGARYFKENDLRKLRVRVKMGDVRSHASGDLDAKGLRNRIEVEEE